VLLNRMMVSKGVKGGVKRLGIAETPQSNKKKQVEARGRRFQRRREFKCVPQHHKGSFRSLRPVAGGER